MDADKIPQRFVADVGERRHVWRRRRVGGPFGQEEWAIDL